MDLLKRELAPILPDAWALIDAEAKRVLALHLAARKLVDVNGPHGWQLAAVGTGRMHLLDAQPVEGVSIGLRTSQPIIELRTPIVLDQMDLDSASRGAQDLNLTAVVRAAEKAARVEDSVVWNGYETAGVRGILGSTPHAPVRVGSTDAYPRAIADAKEVLRKAGISGPFALALGPDDYSVLSSASEDGYPLLKHIERLLVDGPIVWAPALQGAVLMSARGGDFELVIGQDMSIGYAYHDRSSVELYLTETFTFRVLEPEAAIQLVRG